MMISVHMPKAAGTSFLNLLELHYKNKIKADYADRPINNKIIVNKFKAKLYDYSISQYYSEFKANDIKCIHGHFLPYKYRKMVKFEETNYITWLRNPLDRLISHYQYWQRTYHPKDSLVFHKKVIEEKWSFKKFSLSPQIQNIYSKMLWNFPISNFDFIGLVEFFEEDIVFFSKKFLNNKDLIIPNENFNPDLQLDISENLQKEIRAFHKKDYNIYNSVLESRIRR